MADVCNIRSKRSRKIATLKFNATDELLFRFARHRRKCVAFLDRPDETKQNHNMKVIRYCNVSVRQKKTNRASISYQTQPEN